MGGTWIHWEMPHIYREVSLYELQDDWIVTQGDGGKNDFCTITSAEQQRNISHAEEVILSSLVGVDKTHNLTGSRLHQILAHVCRR
jgi:hypothetical protein